MLPLVLLIAAGVGVLVIGVMLILNRPTDVPVLAPELEAAEPAAPQPSKPAAKKPSGRPRKRVNGFAKRTDAPSKNR